MYRRTAERFSSWTELLGVRGVFVGYLGTIKTLEGLSPCIQESSVESRPAPAESTCFATTKTHESLHTQATMEGSSR